MADESPAPSRPRVGCGAAVLDDQGRLLLVKRRRMPEADHWGVPGGKLDWGEAARTCAEREIAEELGIVVRAGPVLAVSDMITDDYHWVAVTYRGELVSGDPVVQEPLALADCGWFSLDALPSPLTLATLDAVAALRA